MAKNRITRLHCESFERYNYVQIAIYTIRFKAKFATYFLSFRVWVKFFDITLGL